MLDSSDFPILFHIAQAPEACRQEWSTRSRGAMNSF